MIPLVLCFFAPFAFDSYTLPKIALAALLVMIVGQWRGFRIKPLTKPLLLLLGAITASALMSGDPVVNLMGRYCSRYLAVLPLMICLLAYHLPVAKNIGAQMRWAGGLLAGYGLLQLVWNPLGYQVLASGHRIIGAMGSPPSLGCALALCLPFCFGRTPARAALVTLVMMALFATGSRGPLLAAAVAAFIVRQPEDRSGAGLAAICFGAVAFAACLSHGASDKIRWMTWVDSMKMWWAHPVFGVGAESYVDYWRVFHDAAWVKIVGPNTYQDYAHNDFLEALAAFGIVGLIAYCNLLWRVLKSDLDRCTLASLAAVFVCAKFNAVPFAVIFAIAILLGAREEGRGYGPADHGRGVSYKAPAILAATLASVFLYALIGDTLFYKARRVLDFPGVMHAAESNPTELFYQAHEADLLARKWQYTHEKDLLVRALLISRAAENTHPASVQAKHMVTQNLLFLAQTDPSYLSEAHAYAEKLISLDPQLNYRFRVVRK